MLFLFKAIPIRLFIFFLGIWNKSLKDCVTFYSALKKLIQTGRWLYHEGSNLRQGAPARKVWKPSRLNALFMWHVCVFFIYTYTLYTFLYVIEGSKPANFYLGWLLNFWENSSFCSDVNWVSVQDIRLKLQRNASFPNRK